MARNTVEFAEIDGQNDRIIACFGNQPSKVLETRQAWLLSASQFMERQFADTRYWTEYVADNADGFAGLRLHRERRGKTNVAAEVIYWDAVGQYYVQTFDGDVPVEILEAVIAETVERVGVR